MSPFLQLIAGNGGVNLSVSLFLCFSVFLHTHFFCRIGGFAAMVIYIITTYALYVPDWSFSVLDNDQLQHYTVINQPSFSHFGPVLCCTLCYLLPCLWLKLWSWFQVVCGVRGHLGPACNAVGHVDRRVWGINHLYNYPVWRRLKVITE